MPRILCLTGHDLDGPDYGAALRCRNLFRLLQKSGEVEVVLAGSNQFWGADRPPACGGFKLVRAIPFQPTRRHSLRERLRQELDPRFQNHHHVQANEADRKWLQTEMGRYDLVWIHGLHTANGLGIWRWPHAVLDIDDIPSSYYQSLLTQATRLADKLRWRRQIFLWRRHEQTLGERFAAISVCSEPDRAVLGGGAKIFSIPNGFAVPATPPVRQPATPPRIGFVGTFEYEPNHEGMRWFVEQVWPLILKKNPETKLRLVGRRSDQGDWRHFPNVEPLGWVADAAAEMDSWSLSIVPVLTGGGTRIKIAESFSRQCPLVSTSLGAYGYDVADGRELLLADSAEKFAEKCLRLLADPAEGRRLAENGWRKFNEHWTWDAQAGRVAAAVKSILGNS